MAAYLEVFVLIGVAAAGSVVVLAAGLGSLASYRGASVAVTEGSIRQGAYLAVETVLVQNTGDSPITSFDLSTTGVSGGASYCYALDDPVSQAALLTTCPAMAAGPGEVRVSETILPGKGAVVELFVTGRAFSPGSVSTVSVTTSAGSQGTLTVEALPA